MIKDDTLHRKKSVIYSLFLLSCICLLSGCTSLPSSSSSNASSTSKNDPSVVAKLTPTPTPDPIKAKVQLLLNKMSPDDKLAQMIMVEFIGSDYTDSGLEQMISEQHVGSFLYQDSDNNFTWPNNTVDAASAFSAKASADETIPPMIAIDQEGGTVSKTSAFFGPTPSAEELAQSNDPNTAYNQAKTDASQLKQLGVNVDLAPVIDVGPDTTQYGSRFFSDDPNTVATYAGQFIKGLQDNGIPGTLKHFPGLGSSDDIDPHVGLPSVTKSLADLQKTDFLPYQKLIEQANPAMVMTTDVATQALDPNVPAELSPKVLAYLRNTLKFNGVVITDGLYMEGLYNGLAPTPDQLAQVSVQAIEAGNDMIEGPSTPDEITSILAAMNAAIQKGDLPQSQVDQSVTRILTMKLKYGIIK